MNTRLNKKVKKDLDAYFKGYRGSEPEVHHALKHILMGALTDANFHAESKKAANMFPKADKSKFAGKTDFEDSIEMNHGVPIAKAAKWDGYEIIDAIAYWASMFIGGPVGAKITSLKEGLNENIRTFVNQFIKEVTHSYEYETMSGKNEDENDKEDFRIGNYHTKYFHVCPGASSLYMDIESKGVDMDMAERSARLHDVLFFVEEHIQRDGYKPEKDYIMVAKNLQKNIMKMAEMMGLEKEHHYIQGHVDIITKTVEGKKLEEKVVNLTEKNVPTNPSKWSYYKSQAKKKFDVYPSAYANAWAAKQYKAAGGGWRKGKSESIEEGVMSNIHLMADASKDFEDFKKKFKKDYKKVFKNTPDFMDWLYGMYKDMAPLKAGEKVEEALSVTDERHFGKKGIIIMIDDNGKKVSAIFKNKKNADKYNRNKSSDLQALLKLAKNTPYPKAIDEATRGEIHKAAKKGNYPATIVVSEKGKVVYQELVKTPQLVPAVFMILQKKYPNAKISVESKSGETLFTEGKAFVVMYKVKKDLSNRNVKPASAAYAKETDAKKFLKSVEKDGGRGMIVKSNVSAMSGIKVNEESVNEYFVENYQDVKELVEFLKENKPSLSEAEYQGRKVELNKIMQGDVKKFKVYVKNPKGNVVKVNFGHKGKGGEKTMSIKKNNPERRKSFRARHNCDNPGPKHKARYWSCRKW